MADIFLNQTQVEDLFSGLMFQLLGINRTTSPGAVRISWPTTGAPAWKITDNVVFLQVTEADSAYNRQRDVKFTPLDADNANQATTYTRVLNVFLAIYGPSSWDNASIIKDKLFYQDHHDTLARSNVFLIPDIAAPRRCPELFNGQWWQRTDLTLQFNELVVRNITVPYIKSAVVTVEATNGDTGIAVIPNQ